MLGLEKNPIKSFGLGMSKSKNKNLHVDTLAECRNIFERLNMVYNLPLLKFTYKDMTSFSFLL